MSEQLPGADPHEPSTPAGASGPIVVGYDGSDSAKDALAWGVVEAGRLGRSLLILHAYVWPLYELPYAVPLDPGSEQAFREGAETLLDEAYKLAGAQDPHVDVHTLLKIAPPAQAILEEAQDASLVVVGSRGLGGVAGLLIGSVGVHVAAHAPCPVVVMRRPNRRPTGADAGQVVVGVDGSVVSDQAIEFAFEQASTRGLGLTAVHAWDHPALDGPGVMLPLVVDFEQAEREELLMLSGVLDPFRERYPEVPVVQRLVRARATRAIVEAADGAALLVVGSRGRGGFAGLLLGSVSVAALNHAHCPVAVVRPHRTAPRG